MTEPTKQVMCEKCGRSQDAENIGDYENPKWIMPNHKVIKGNGSKKIITCKNSGLAVKF